MKIKCLTRTTNSLLMAVMLKDVQKNGDFSIWPLIALNDNPPS